MGLIDASCGYDCLHICVPNVGTSYYNMFTYYGLWDTWGVSGFNHAEDWLL